MEKYASGTGGADHHIGTVVDRRRPPRRKRNAEVRAREYLTEGEIEGLTSVAKGNRHGHRDATTMLVAYRHGLRAAELVTLRWDPIDFDKGGLPSVVKKGGSNRPIQVRSRAAGPSAVAA